MQPESTSNRRARRVRHALRQKASNPAIMAKAGRETARPRLSVFRSNTNMYAQIIDDSKGHTLVSASTMEKKLKSGLKSTRSIDAAAAIGKAVAERASKAGITEVYFDRGSFRYTGRLKALADAAREAGLKF